MINDCFNYLHTDENGEKLLIPSKDVGETIEALKVLQNRSRQDGVVSDPLRIFVSPPGVDFTAPTAAQLAVQQVEDEPVVKDAVIKGKETIFQLLQAKLQTIESYVDGIVHSFPGFLGQLRVRHFLFFLLGLLLCYLLILLTIAISRNSSAADPDNGESIPTEQVHTSYLLAFASKIFRLLKLFFLF